MNRMRLAMMTLMMAAAFAVGGDSCAASEPGWVGTLLYSRLTDNVWQIWQLDLASRQARQVTFTPGDKRHPGWAPAGRVIYCTSNQACFQSEPGSAGADLLLADLWPVRDAAWSPDGQWLAFSRFRTDLVDSANLWIADAEGDNRRVLTHAPGIQQHPAWSPDGTRLAYSGGQGPRSYELYLVTMDGMQTTRLTTNEAEDLFPVWSPDGARIAYSSNASGDYEMWVVGVDGANAVQLTHTPGLDTNPAWSPDGEWLAFASNRSGTMEIWVMRPDGSDQQLLEKVEGGACDPAWR